MTVKLIIEYLLFSKFSFTLFTCENIEERSYIFSQIISQMISQMISYLWKHWRTFLYIFSNNFSNDFSNDFLPVKTVMKVRAAKRAIVTSIFGLHWKGDPSRNRISNTKTLFHFFIKIQSSSMLSKFYWNPTAA